MKMRPVVIYIAVFLVFIAALIIFSNITKQSNKEVAQSQMPNDDAHKGMSDVPSQSNVMKEVYEKMDLLKAEYEKNPKDTLKMREYADMLTLSHKSDEALKIYNDILIKDPKRIDIMLQCTFVYFNENKFDRALEMTNRALAVDKNHLASKYNLGAIYNAKGERDRAISIWKEVAQNYPNTQVGQIAAQSLKQLETKK